MDSTMGTFAEKTIGAIGKTLEKRVSATAA